MITLHESNITSFPLDNGIGVLSDAIVAYTEEELNGMFEFYMEYDSEGAFVDELKEERIIKAKAQDKLGYQLFRIYSITKNHENDNIIVNAQHITYDLANNFVEKMEANRLTKKQVMEKIGNSTVEPHPFNVTSSNTTTVSSTNLYRTNPLQMIAGMDGSVLQIWGGQIERDNFNLILHDRRGHDDGVKVSYEKNITGLEATFDTSNLVTRIFPFVYIEATDDTPERLITVSGKYIDSPHINDYEQIYIEPIDYSHDDRIDTQDKTDAEIRQQLESVASTYFEETGNDRVKASMDVAFMHLWETEEYKHVAPLELVGMGDTVTINHSRLKVDATAIVNYIRYDCIAHVNEEVRLGNVKAGLTDSVNKINTIERKVEQAESNANQAIISANGKNTTYYGPDEPTTGMQKGDLWFKVIDGQYHKTYRYDGIEWQLIIDMDSAEAKAEAQQAKDRADEAVNRANQATEDANKAIEQAQAGFDLAQESLSKSTALEGDVTNLSTMVNEHTGEISTIKQSTSGLQTTVSELQAELDELEIGGRNFLLNTTTESLTLDNPNSFDTVEINGITVSPNFLESAKGKEVTISIEARSTGYETGTSPWIGVECAYYGNDGTTKYLNVQLRSTLDTDGEWRRYSRTVSLPLDISSMRNSVTMLIRNIKGFVQIKQPKLEIGTVATDWTPAPEDIDHQFSVITQTIDSITTRIGDAEGNITALQQTSSSLAGRLSSAEGNITTLTATVDGLQTTVSDIDGNVSNLTQLSNAMQTRLSDAEGNINTLTQTVDSTVSRISSLANPNLITHDPNKWVEVFGFKGVEERIPVKKNTDYVLTDYSTELIDNIQVNYDNQFIDADVGGEFIFNTGESDSVNVVITSSDPDFYKKLGTVYRFKLEEGTESTAWTAHDEDIYTQYSQLSDAINLRVAKGDVINQINLDTSGVLISGKKLVLDGDTTVKGTFKVGNANITSIDAGKITVGDLVGHSLVGGSVIGGYIEQQSDGNRVEIRNGTVSHYRYGELKSTMDGSGHKFYQNGSYIGHIGTATWVDDSGYRGLIFGLENDADYMSWGYKKTSGASAYTTMLAWHKTSNKDNKGFTFNDNVHIPHGNNLYVSRILTTGNTSRRAVELQNYTWDGGGGVLLTRAPSRGDRTAGLFMTSKKAVLIDGGNSYIEVGNDSTGNYVESIAIWNRTSSNSSNVRVGSSGKLYRTSSASKYKLLIENEEEKGYNYNNILNLNIKSWYDKLEAETLYDLTTNDLTDYEDEYKPYLRRHFGLVAEDLEEAGLKEFIEYNDETGEIEGIKYDRLWTLLIPITRQHRDDIEWLKLENQYLKQKIKQLEEMIA